MKMKKTLTAVVAMALVAAVSVAGTLAYLKAESQAVKNTFTAGKLGGEDFGITLQETNVKKDVNGQFILGEGTTQENVYDGVLPNSTNAKDPYVTVNGLDTEAYLFIEVMNDENDLINATVNDTLWKEVAGVKPHVEGAKVYRYKETGKVDPSMLGDLAKVEVLVDNQFTVKDFTNEQAAAPDFAANNLKPITVNAYICQSAGFADATAAWNGAFAPQA